ncbi:hypothetical protein Anas_09003 [Armadillidium nasatum]|uniref:Uncharacterized protein n=1 Tax=Armadillidium nasatum TaxID=96803 RepID=A0A5N5TLR4_9CRUS|nr:hypothetical protein Anas_09003 [Armadillidium nasatum]
MSKNFRNMKVNINFLLISAILLLMTENFNEASRLCVTGGTGVEGTGNCPNTSGIITTCEIKPGHCYCDRRMSLWLPLLLLWLRPNMLGGCF